MKPGVFPRCQRQQRSALVSHLNLSLSQNRPRVCDSFVVPERVILLAG
ncbi:mCG147626 [Mus musculus]|nr:mCG147626 [Mus musculus]